MRCSACNGRGLIRANRGRITAVCKTCGGSGDVPDEGFGHMDLCEVCPNPTECIRMKDCGIDRAMSKSKGEREEAM